MNTTVTPDVVAPLKLRGIPLMGRLLQRKYAVASGENDGYILPIVVLLLFSASYSAVSFGNSSVVSAAISAARAKALSKASFTAS